MPQKTGSYDIASLLDVRHQSVKEFGLNTVQEILERDTQAHNVIVEEMVGDMCEMTDKAVHIYGTSADGEMVEVDEFGRAPGQSDRPGANTAVPLKKFQFNVGWNSLWFELHTPADLATQVQSAQKAHWRAIQREIKKAVYLSGNYSFTDHLVDKVALSIKRFVNADSDPIPNGPNGETYDGASHTHYDAVASLTASALKNSINDVIEHGHGAKVYTAINKADETAVRALTGFSPYVDPRLSFSTIASAAGVPGKTLDISRLDNRAIGIFEGAEVWVKPWALASYPFTWDAGSTAKPLHFRQRVQKTLQGLRTAAENDAHPMFAKFMEAEYGIAVWTRTNGAVLYTGGGSYVDPTIS